MNVAFIIDYSEKAYNHSVIKSFRESDALAKKSIASIKKSRFTASNINIVKAAFLSQQTSTLHIAENDAIDKVVAETQGVLMKVCTAD